MDLIEPQDPLAESPSLDESSQPRPRRAAKPHRVRNHVNPFHYRYQTLLAPPKWSELFGDPHLPLHLDIGCGPGRFLLRMAEKHPNWNFLGLEIRQPLTVRANQWKEESGLGNVHFLFANVNVTLKSLLATGSLSRVTIQFPDPWFKKRHHKRRVVQPQLVADLALLLQPGSLVFLQSDIEPVAAEMAARFRACPEWFSPPHPLTENPLGIPTERETHCQSLGVPIYRYQVHKRPLSSS